MLLHSREFLKVTFDIILFPEVYRDHQRNIDNLNEVTIASSIDLNATFQNFNDISNIKASHETEVDLNKTYIVDDKNFEDPQPKYQVKVADKNSTKKDDFTLTGPPKEQNEVILKKIEQEVVSLNLEIEELDRIMKATQSINLKEE